MERYFLLDETENTVTILDQIYSNSIEEAQEHFNCKGWVIGEVISETDWNNELELNSLENQTYEG
jgi:hypothetical protein